ncbi:MAG: hypothetical protein ACC651_14010 [Candidatus Scalindua sp.]
MYFKIGDFSVSIIIGGMTGLCTFWVVGTCWNMLLAMFIGMCIGMISQILISLIFMPLFGHLEIMIPSMITGMLSGMCSGMIAVAYPLPLRIAFVLGGGVGIIVCLWVYKRNRQLQGVVQ